MGRPSKYGDGFKTDAVALVRSTGWTIESFSQRLTRELTGQRGWATKNEARLDLLRWLSYHNHRQCHSALQYLTPVEFEQRLIKSGGHGLPARNPAFTPGEQPQSRRHPSAAIATR